MDFRLAIYKDMFLSMNIGQKNGNKYLSKPIFLLAVLGGIKDGFISDNIIVIENKSLRKRYAEIYESVYHNRKGYELSFFIRPYYHLGSSDFYDLVWRDELKKINPSITPSGKFLKEYLQYAKFDDELWVLLQVAENREFLKRNIIEKYFKNP